MTRWASDVPTADRVEQFKLIYDYIKFHLGMYVATPPVFAIVAEAFDANNKRWFQIGLAAMIGIYVISGSHAGLFMARHINEPWSTNFLSRFEREAFSPIRRTMHHSLYWLGIAVGLVGLVLAILTKW